MDSNHRMAASKAAALPLGYSPIGVILQPMCDVSEVETSWRKAISNKQQEIEFHVLPPLD